jgi:hypothetical protein
MNRTVVPTEWFRLVIASASSIFLLGVASGCSDDSSNAPDTGGAMQDASSGADVRDEGDVSPDASDDPPRDTEVAPRPGNCVSIPNIRERCRMGTASECSFVCDRVLDAGTGDANGADGRNGEVDS